MSEKTRILIVEDNLVFQTGTSFLLQRCPDFEIAGVASDGEEALHKYDATRPDVVFMDMNMPNMDGIEATRQLNDKYDDARVLACSTEKEQKAIVEIVQNGALGFIYKGSPAEEVIEAIKTVAAGKTYFSKDIFHYIVANLQAPEATVKKPAKLLGLKLSERELEILKCIAEEMTNKEIAQKLYISPRTVDTHRRNLLQKLNVKNTAGLVKSYMMLTM